MQRYNIFNQIHKGLRAMLYDTALALQQTDFINPDEAEAVLSSMDKVLNCFHSHAMHEDRFVFPAVQQFDPGLVHEFEAEHKLDESLAHRLCNLIPVYDRAVSGEAKQEAGDAISNAFNEFVAFNLYHMSKEEDKINKALWANYTDEGIKEIHRCILAALPPTGMEFEARWMMKGISNQEIVRWLKVVENTAPQIVFRGLLSLAENELPVCRWDNIKESLTEGVMIAQ